jgi:hypothetical protein
MDAATLPAGLIAPCEASISSSRPMCSVDTSQQLSSSVIELAMAYWRHAIT